MEYYSAIIRDKLQIHTTQMNLQSSRFKWKKPKKKKPSKGNLSLTSFRRHSWKDKYIGIENRSVMAKG